MVFVVVVLLLGYQFGSAQQTENSWLIGRWDGNIEGFKGQGGPARMLRVHSISTEEAIVSLFGVPPGQELMIGHMSPRWTLKLFCGILFADGWQRGGVRASFSARCSQAHQCDAQIHGGRKKAAK